MKKVISIIACVVIQVLFIVACKDSQHGKHHTKTSVDTLSKELVSHFADNLIRKVKLSNLDYDRLGLHSGVDAFMLRKTFPGFKSTDFNDISTHHGNYIVNGDTLYFNGNAASNSAVLGIDGMKTLLKNCASRFLIRINNKNDVNRIIDSLSIH